MAAERAYHSISIGHSPKSFVNVAGVADIALMDAFEATPGIGYQHGAAALLLRRAGSTRKWFRRMVLPASGVSRK